MTDFLCAMSAVITALTTTVDFRHPPSPTSSVPNQVLCAAEVGASCPAVKRVASPIRFFSSSAALLLRCASQAVARIGLGDSIDVTEASVRGARSMHAPQHPNRPTWRQHLAGQPGEAGLESYRREVWVSGTTGTPLQVCTRCPTTWKPDSVFLTSTSVSERSPAVTF